MAGHHHRTAPLPELAGKSLADAAKADGRPADTAFARRGAPGLTASIDGAGSNPATTRQDQEGGDVSMVTYVGCGVDIEDDAVRLRRRKLEFEGDAARLSQQSKPRRRRKDLGPVSAISGALARWR